MKCIDGGVTLRKLQAAGIAAGIKKGNTKDMAMIYSEKPCTTAGTFTTNLVKAAPVKWDQKVVYEAPYTQAVVCNSGIANACTGAEGYGYCEATAKAAAEVLDIPKESVLVASTGVIGQQLPMEKLEAGVKKLARFYLVKTGWNPGGRVYYDYRYSEKRSGCGDRIIWKNRDHWRYVQRLRYDSS